MKPRQSLIRSELRTLKHTNKIIINYVIYFVTSQPPFSFGEEIRFYKGNLELLQAYVDFSITILNNSFCPDILCYFPRNELTLHGHLVKLLSHQWLCLYYTPCYLLTQIQDHSTVNLQKKTNKYNMLFNKKKKRLLSQLHAFVLLFIWPPQSKHSQNKRFYIFLYYLFTIINMCGL